MPSYVIVGASRGIGLEFVAHLSSSASNAVFALARNPAGASALLALGAERPNVHVLKADMTDPAALKAAADEVEKATGGALDVLVNNGAIAGEAWTALDEYPSEDALIADFRAVFDTNVLGAILPTNAFLPLLKRGATKKVLSLSTGLADPAAVRAIGHKYAVAYSVSKTGVEMANIKYSAKYAQEGFTFLTISPGIVKTDMNGPPAKPEDEAKRQEVLAQFALVAPPDYGGPISPNASVRAMLAVLDGASPADSGKFLSHHGDRNWL